MFTDAIADNVYAILKTLFWGVLVFYALKLFKSYARLHFCHITEISKIPGPPKKNIFVGNIDALFVNAEELFAVLRKFGKEHWPIYKLWIGHVFTVSICCPEDFELVTSNIKHITKGDTYAILDNWLKTGLLTSTGNKWQLRRKILTPAFHFSMLQQFISIFNEETARLVEQLKVECDKPWTDVNSYITEFTLNTIGETSMGSRFDSMGDAQKEYKQAIFDIVECMLYKVLRPLMYRNIIYCWTSHYRKEMKLIKKLHKFTDAVISERQKTFKGLEMPISDDENITYSSRKRLAMLDLLLSVKLDQGLIDDEGIREEVDTFMFEGHDTTAAAICFALMLIANNKDVQDQLVQEMQEVFGGDIHKKPTYKELQELKYMERCIKEVLRLYPSVHYISRVLGEDIVSHSGYLIPANTIMHLHIYDLHHNAGIYPDPEKFDPDRFLPENTQKRHPFAYVPFSAGPRNCIGQRFAMLELKAVLCGILANYVLEPIDTQESVVLVVDLVLRTKDKIKVKFVPRVSDKV